MTSASPRLSRVSTATAILFALAAAPASARPAFLKLGGVEGDTGAAAEGKKDFYKGWIELNSWSWGETRAAGKGNVEFEWKVEEGESAPPRPTRPSDVTLKRGTTAAGDPDRPIIAGRLPNAGVEREMKESGEKGGTEDINIGVGELQEATITKSMDKSTPRLMEASAKGKVFSSPAPRGSMTTLVPAGACRVGARYPTAKLDTGTMIFEMENTFVTSCSSRSGSGGESLPMEEISFNYGKIRTVSKAQDRTPPRTKVRGWDPEKNE